MTHAIHHWIHEHIELSGAKMTGEIENVRITPTSTVLRVATDRGMVYFKAPGFAYEAPLTEALAAWFPANMPGVLATDRARGWLLTADAGRELRVLIRASSSVDEYLPHLEEMLRQYAALQQATGSRVGELLAFGVPDRRTEKLPHLYKDLLENPSTLLVGKENGLSEAQLAQLRAYLPQLETLCRRLAEYNIPPTLHHDDFHTANMAIRGKDCVFMDWGESCIAHPFYSLMMVLRVTKFLHEGDEATLNRLQQVYLGCWTAFEPMSRLLEAYALAAQLGALCRALTWHQINVNLDEKDRGEDAEAVPYWLLTFFNNSTMEL